MELGNLQAASFNYDYSHDADSDMSTCNCNGNGRCEISTLESRVDSIYGELVEVLPIIKKIDSQIDDIFKIIDDL